MGYESIVHLAEGRMGYWLRVHEGERNNCFSEIQLVGQKYWDKTFLASFTWEMAKTRVIRLRMIVWLRVIWCPQISKGFFFPWLDGFWHFNKVSIYLRSKREWSKCVLYIPEEINMIWLFVKV